MSEKAHQLTEDELLLIETFVRSPVYGAYRKLMDSYRQQVINELLTERDPVKIHQLQGRLIALNAVEELPRIRAQAVGHKRAAKIKAENEKDAQAAALERRRRA